MTSSRTWKAPRPASAVPAATSTNPATIQRRLVRTAPRRPVSPATTSCRADEIAGTRAAMTPVSRASAATPSSATGYTR